MKHITVLKKEAVELLALTDTSIVVDATYGAGGHAREICGKLGRHGVYIGIDADERALENSFLHSADTVPRYHLVARNFREIKDVVRSLHITKVDAILADLGWRTDQFTDGNKGFSFLNDEPLLMTYGDPSGYPFTAADIVNHWTEEDIANVIYGYGEERLSRRIARAIVEARRKQPITSSLELATIITAVYPKRHDHRIHPATRTFQALRIAVNDELSVLETFIADAASLLSPQGVLAIITFHSLEDRLVKLAFRSLAATEDFTVLTKKPIVPSETELKDNNRARSAKLRGLIRNKEENTPTH
jgi:16S rRNA (cytosine1402-N4)-methyltransferase